MVVQKEDRSMDKREQTETEHHKRRKSWRHSKFSNIRPQQQIHTNVNKYSNLL